MLLVARRHRETAISARARRRAPRPSGAPASRAALQMLDAADVGRDDGRRLPARRGGPSLRSRSALASSGCSTEYVPAEPQHRCASLAATRTSKPSARERRLDHAATRWPCCRVHGGWNARRVAPAVRPCELRRSIGRVRAAVRRRRVSGRRSVPPSSRTPGSRASEWPYSLTVTPHPDAFMTIASTSPRSHHAATRRRCSSACASSAPSRSPRCRRIAPQQPAPRRRWSGCRRRRGRARSRC